MPPRTHAPALPSPSSLLLALLYCMAALCTSVRASGPAEACAGQIIQLTVGMDPTDTDAGNDQVAQTLYGVKAPFGSAMNASEGQGVLVPTPVLVSKPLNACTDLPGHVAGHVVLVERGNCSFVDKAINVQRAEGVAMLMFNNETGCANMGYDPNTTSYTSVTIPVISISHHEADIIRSLMEELAPHKVYALLEVVSVRGFDPSFFLLWTMAVFTVCAGSVLSGWDHEQQYKAHGPSTQQAGGTTSLVRPEDTVDITMGFAVAFVVLASVVLLLLFFFLSSVVFYILLVFFCMASIQSMTTLFVSSIIFIVPSTSRLKPVQVPVLGPCPTLALACVPIAAAISIVWVVFRNSPWSWILQDFQGVCLMLIVMRTLKLNSVKVASVLLSLLFVYDVFWVFIEPLIFGGESVMVAVAKGGGTQEYLPMLLRVPRLLYRELGGYSMLGYGDVILPGVLVAYTRRLDIDLRLMPSATRLSYFLPTMFGYGCGLLLTYCALVYSWFGDQGQPALLYLVPCTLGTVFLVGLLRGELSLLWHANSSGSTKRYKPVRSEDGDMNDASNDIIEADVESGTPKGGE